MSVFYRGQYQPGLEHHGIPGRFFPPPINLGPFLRPPLFLPDSIGRLPAPKLFIAKANTVYPRPNGVYPGSYRAHPMQNDVYPTYKDAYPRYKDVYPRYKDAYPQTKRVYPIREAQLQNSIPMSLVPMTKFPAEEEYNHIFSENPRPVVNPFVGIAFPGVQSPRQAPRDSGEPKRWQPSQGKDDNANQN